MLFIKANMPTDTGYHHTFFIAHARFILPVPWLALACMTVWDAIHTGAAGRWLPAAGFAGLALLMYLVQRHVHRQRGARR